LIWAVSFREWVEVVDVSWRFRSDVRDWVLVDIELRGWTKGMICAGTVMWLFLEVVAEGMLGWREWITGDIPWQPPILPLW
jgi:hypothetical protein